MKNLFTKYLTIFNVVFPKFWKNFEHRKIISLENTEKVIHDPT